MLRVNSYLYGDQYAPRISSIGVDYLVVWTSLAQDGSREGVFGRSLNGNGTLASGEFRVNTTTAGQQMQPSVASDGVNQFVVVWTSYTGSPNNFDLFAQRYININLASSLPPMSAPFVWAPFVLSNGVYQPQLRVAWPSLLGIAVSNYEVYADGVTNAPMATLTSNLWTMTAANGLTDEQHPLVPGGLRTTGGRQSPLSPSASGTTWSGLSWGGIPYEWMAAFFGGYSGGAYHTNFWPSASAPVAAGGPTLLQVFLRGGESVRFQHLAATNPRPKHAGPVPELEHAAGPHLSGADKIQPHRRLDQSGRAAVRGGRERFHLCRGRSGGLLPGPVPVLMK